MDLDELSAIAARALSDHGLRGWSFGFSKARRRLGVCKYRPKRIEIAEYYARNSPPASVLDTLFHEIAHAIAGSSAGHGPRWKAVAVRLGATPRACDTSPETVVEPGDWRATCPACGRTFHRYRRPIRLGGYRCRCAARASLTFRYEGDGDRAPAPPTSPRDSARWEATCRGCGTVHLRIRRPKAGLWQCRCPARCGLTWSPRASGCG